MNTPLTACEDDYKASPEKIKDLEAMISYIHKNIASFMLICAEAKGNRSVLILFQRCWTEISIVLVELNTWVGA